MISLEVCSGSVESAIQASRGGAVRVELCDNLFEGGTTPSMSQIKLTRQLIDIQLNVIIRPRGGDFYYSPLEFESMKEDIHLCGQLKCDGVVIGMLLPDGSVDVPRNKELISIAKQYGLSVTFHRAIDRCNDLPRALETIIDLGCDRILTSGGKPTAVDGKLILKDLIAQAGDRISIMPGSGITPSNIAELVKTTGLKEFHGTFRTPLRGGMTYLKPEFSSNIKDEFYYYQTNASLVAEAIKNANSGF